MEIIKTLKESRCVVCSVMLFTVSTVLNMNVVFAFHIRQNVFLFAARSDCSADENSGCCHTEYVKQTRKKSQHLDLFVILSDV